MGIREYFEKHPEKDLKLQNLDLEQDQPEKISFNTETDLTEQDWERLNAELKEARKKSDIDFVTRLIAIKIINPQQAQELLHHPVRSRLNETLKGYIERELDFFNKSHYDKSQQFFLAVSVMVESLVGLKEFYKAEYELTDQQWFFVLQAIESKKEFRWSHFCRAAFMLAISFPEKAKELDLIYHDFYRMKTEIEKFRKKEKWEEFAKVAMIAKVLFPEESKKEFRIDDQAWQGMLDILEIYRKGEFEDDRDSIESPEWWNEEWHLAAMQILAAEKIEITDQGLKLTMPKADLKQTKKPIPERLKF